jgi:hypothetical protein
MNKIHSNDPLEVILANALQENGIDFIHESEGKYRLDFYLPKLDVFVEVKRFHSDRTGTQMSLHDNIILLQGEKSVKFFVDLITKQKSP